MSRRRIGWFDVVWSLLMTAVFVSVVMWAANWSSDRTLFIAIMGLCLACGNFFRPEPRP